MYRLLFCVYVCVKAAVRQLKYITKYFVDKQKRVTKKRVMGIEPTYPAWKAGVLPLNYTRIKCMKLNTAEQKPLFLFECPVPESNQRHEDFQSSALPTELTGRLTTKFILKEKGFAVKQKMQIFLIFFII